MDIIRRLRSTFVVVCNNSPLAGHPLCFLYVFRHRYHGSTSNTVTAYQHLFACARLCGDLIHIRDVSVTPTGITTWFGYGTLEPTIQFSYPRWIEYPVGTHIQYK